MVVMVILGYFVSFVSLDFIQNIWKDNIIINKNLLRIHNILKSFFDENTG